MRQLLDIQQQLLTQLSKKRFYQRDIFSQMSFDNFATGIIGGRGVGKTTFLLNVTQKNIASGKPTLYISADNLYFLTNNLIELVDQLYKTTDIRFICIDEIHKYDNWQQELKNITDIYQDVTILFSGSSMIDIIKAKFDLSRRVIIHHLHGLSFREYLDFKLDYKVEKFDLDTLTKQHVEIAQSLHLDTLLKYFNNYCQTGYYPFTERLPNTEDSKQALENIIQKIIYEDIAVQMSLKTPTLLLIEKLFKYIVNSAAGELNANKLANLIEKSFDNTTHYLTALRDSGLIRVASHKKFGKAAFKANAKLYPENSNFMHAYSLPNFLDKTIGKIRETFFINQLQNAGHDVYLSQHGDFEINDFTFEVGGKNKTFKQLKDTKNDFIAADDILIGSKDKIPLYLFGLLC